LQDVSEYGYGMWVRYSSTYPAEHVQSEEYYFLSRLTTNSEFQDFQRYGDRTLAVFVVRNVFVFATYDFAKKQKNLFENKVEVDSNIDGVICECYHRCGTLFSSATLRKYTRQSDSLNDTGRDNRCNELISIVNMYPLSTSSWWLEVHMYDFNMHSSSITKASMGR
jgi:hypothetical protein